MKDPKAPHRCPDCGQDPTKPPVTPSGHELAPLGIGPRCSSDLLARALDSFAREDGRMGLRMMAAWDKQAGRSVGALCVTVEHGPVTAVLPIAIIPNDAPVSTLVELPGPPGSHPESFTGNVDELLAHLSPSPEDEALAAFAGLDDSKLPKA